MEKIYDAEDNVDGRFIFKQGEEFVVVNNDFSKSRQTFHSEEQAREALEKLREQEFQESKIAFESTLKGEKSK